MNKFNFIMGVTPNKVINFTIQDEPVNSTSFMKFLE